MEREVVDPVERINKQILDPHRRASLLNRGGAIREAQ